MAAVAALPADDAAAIAAASRFGSLPTVVDYLVAQALAASARAVKVTVDLEALDVAVEHDGADPAAPLPALALVCSELEALAGARGATRDLLDPARPVPRRKRRLSAGGAVVRVRGLFARWPVRQRRVHDDGDALPALARALGRTAVLHSAVGFSLFNSGTGQFALRAPAAESLRARVAQVFGAELAAAMVPFGFATGSAALAGLAVPPAAPLPRSSTHTVRIVGDDGRPAAPELCRRLAMPAARFVVLLSRRPPGAALGRDELRVLAEGAAADFRRRSPPEPPAPRRRDSGGGGFVRPAPPPPATASATPPENEPRTEDALWIARGVAAGLDRVPEAQASWRDGVRFALEQTPRDAFVALGRVRRALAGGVPVGGGEFAFLRFFEALLAARGGDAAGVLAAALPTAAEPASAAPALRAAADGPRWAVPAPRLRTRLSRELLRGARVLGQVSRQFILLAHGGLLAAVDQHAAHERVRLERLEAALAAGLPTRAVRPPLRVELAPADAADAARFAGALRAWGWAVAAGDAWLEMRSVPEVDGVPLSSDDLRAYIGELRAAGAGAGGARFPRPAAVTRALHSRACRGAIMFGDALTRPQCVELVRELAQCKLAFQCAHGRPSGVPLCWVPSGSVSASVGSASVSGGGSALGGGSPALRRELDGPGRGLRGLRGR